MTSQEDAVYSILEVNGGQEGEMMTGESVKLFQRTSHEIHPGCYQTVTNNTSSINPESVFSRGGEGLTQHPKIEEENVSHRLMLHSKKLAYQILDEIQFV